MEQKQKQKRPTEYAQQLVIATWALVIATWATPIVTALVEMARTYLRAHMSWIP